MFCRNSFCQFAKGVPTEHCFCLILKYFKILGHLAEGKEGLFLARTLIMSLSLSLLVHRAIALLFHGVHVIESLSSLITS